MSVFASKAGATGFAIDLSHVAKTYRGRVQALRNITMQVQRGEIYGLLGPNGAGKSTLVKILMTVIKPTSCKGTMLDKPVGHKETLTRVGYLPEHHRFAEYLTGAQVVDFYGRMTCIPRVERRKRTGALLDLVGMSDWANKKVKSYSKGMRQRIGIAQSLINNPDLVLLDEPTDGVDPVGRKDIREVLIRLKNEGKTVFINSHLLSELELVCDRVAILVQGVVSSQGTIDELTKDDQGYEIEVATGLDDAAAGALPVAWTTTTGPARSLFKRSTGEDALESELPPRRGTLNSGPPIEVRGGTIRINSVEPELVQPILDSLRSRGLIIKAVRPIRPSLEDLFMQAVTDPNSGEVLKPGAKGKAKKGGTP